MNKPEITEGCRVQFIDSSFSDLSKEFGTVVKRKNDVQVVVRFDNEKAVENYARHYAPEGKESNPCDLLIHTDFIAVVEPFNLDITDLDDVERFLNEHSG